MADWMSGFGEVLNGRGLLLTVSIALIGTVLLMLLRKRLPLTLPWRRGEKPGTEASQPSLTQARRAYEQQENDAFEKTETLGVEPGAGLSEAALCPTALSRRIDAMEAKLKTRSASRRA